MGLQLNVDLDTNVGATKQAYLRLETCRINKVQAQIEFTTSVWVNKESADKFYRKYLDDPMSNASGLLTREVVYYKDETDTKGLEVTLDNYFKVPCVKEVEIEEPVYETKKTSKTVPYVSFDENGEEVVKEKVVEKEEQVQVGVNKIKKLLIDYSLMENPIAFAYEFLKQELSKHFPSESITNA